MAYQRQPLRRSDTGMALLILGGMLSAVALGFDNEFIAGLSTAVLVHALILFVMGDKK